MTAKSQRKPKELELDPDAWPKFEALVKSAAKLGHRPHSPKKHPAKRASARKRAPSA